MKNLSHPRLLVRAFCALALATGLFVPSTPAWADSYSLSWFTLDGGGGSSSGGEFSLDGTVGQADAGECAGGAFALSGGFWTGAYPGSRPALSVQRAGSQLVLRWPAWGANWVPLGKDSLGERSTWQSIPQRPVLSGGEWSVTLAAGANLQFFVLWLP